MKMKVEDNTVTWTVKCKCGYVQKVTYIGNGKKLVSGKHTIKCLKQLNKLYKKR